MHLLIFWGFLILAVGTGLIFFQMDFTLPIASYSFFRTALFTSGFP